MGSFEFRQFAKQTVVSRVRDFWSGLDVVEIVVPSDLSPEGNESSLDICRRHGLEN
jgi:hypothetical protein